MANDAIDLAILSSKTLRKGQLAKDILEVAEADYKTVLRGIAAQEIAAQQALGNHPTHLIVDGKQHGSVSDAKYSVVALFVDGKSMVAALNDVWRELQREARRVTGRTAQRFEVWTSERTPTPHKAGDTPNTINADALNISTALYVVGPLVPHTRKYQWYFGPGGPKQFRRSRALQYKNLKARDKPRVAYTIHQNAARAVQRKYPWLRITDIWVSTPNVNPSGKTAITRVPAVAILSRNKGALH